MEEFSIDQICLNRFLLMVKDGLWAGSPSCYKRWIIFPKDIINLRLFFCGNIPFWCHRFMCFSIWCRFKLLFRYISCLIILPINFLFLHFGLWHPTQGLHFASMSSIFQIVMTVAVWPVKNNVFSQWNGWFQPLPIINWETLIPDEWLVSASGLMNWTREGELSRTSFIMLP